jgi:sugar lactone lactonase YvrE
MAIARHMLTIKRHLSWILILAGCCMLIAAMPAAAQLAVDSTKESREPVGTELLWPAPPLPTRIRYVGSVASPDDVGREKGFWAKVVEFFVGPEDDVLLKPMAVAVDGDNRLLVADPAAKRVHIYDQEKGDYSTVDMADEELSLPMGLAVDSRNDFYVSDGVLGKIFRFSSDGDYKRSYGGTDILQRPTSIAVDTSRGRLYVVDTPSHNIKLYNLEDGKLISTIGRRGQAHGEFNYPTYITLDNEGNFFVTDSLNGRVQIFTPDGQVSGVFGQFGDGSGDFSAPKGLAVDSEGHVYVTDAGFDNLQIFDERGRLLLFIGTAGQAPGEFWMPTGLYMDKNDKLYVADSYNKRVQIFQYLKAGAQ